MSHSSATHRPLERAPGNADNWVERSGGLPSYIERIAKHIRSDSGLSTSRAIASAISQVKRWARGGGDVSAATRAKAAKAVAQWSALKAKNKARQATNLSIARLEGRVVDLAAPATASTDGPRSTVPADQLDTTQRAALARRGRAIGSTTRGGRFPIRNTTDLNKAIRAYGRANPEDRSKVRAHIIRQARRLRALGQVPDAWLNMAAPHVGLSALELAAVFDGDADIIDLAAVNGRHVPGTPYNWKHGYIPLNARTAIAHNKGFWVTPSGQRKTVADARKKLGVTSNAALKKRMAANPEALEVAEKKPVRNRPTRAQGPAPARPQPAEKPAAPSARGNRPRLVAAKGNPRHRVEEYPDGSARVRDTQANTTTGRMPRAEADTYATAQNKAKPRRRTRPDAEPPGGWNEADRVPEGQRRLTGPSKPTETVVGAKATKYKPHEVVKRSGRFHVRDSRTGKLSAPMSKGLATSDAEQANARTPAPVEDLGDGWAVQRQKDGSGWRLSRNGHSVDVYKTRAAAVDRSQGIASGDSLKWAPGIVRKHAPGLRAQRGQQSYRERKAPPAQQQSGPPRSVSATTSQMQAMTTPELQKVDAELHRYRDTLPMGTPEFQRVNRAALRSEKELRDRKESATPATPSALSQRTYPERMKALRSLTDEKLSEYRRDINDTASRMRRNKVPEDRRNAVAALLEETYEVAAERRRNAARTAPKATPAAAAAPTAKQLPHPAELAKAGNVRTRLEKLSNAELINYQRRAQQAQDSRISVDDKRHARDVEGSAQLVMNERLGDAATPSADRSALREQVRATTKRWQEAKERSRAAAKTPAPSNDSGITFKPETRRTSDTPQANTTSGQVTRNGKTYNFEVRRPKTSHGRTQLTVTRDDGGTATMEMRTATFNDPAWARALNAADADNAVQAVERAEIERTGIRSAQGRRQLAELERRRDTARSQTERASFVRRIQQHKEREQQWQQRQDEAAAAQQEAGRAQRRGEVERAEIKRARREGRAERPVAAQTPKPAAAAAPQEVSSASGSARAAARRMAEGGDVTGRAKAAAQRIGQKAAAARGGQATPAMRKAPDATGPQFAANATNVVQGAGTPEDPRIRYDNGRWIVEARNPRGQVARGSVLADDVSGPSAAQEAEAVANREAMGKAGGGRLPTSRERAQKLAADFADIAKKAATERKRAENARKRREKAAAAPAADDGGLFPAPKPVRPKKGDRSTPEEFAAGTRIQITTPEGEEITGQIWSASDQKGTVFAVGPDRRVYRVGAQGGKGEVIASPAEQRRMAQQRRSGEAREVYGTTDEARMRELAQPGARMSDAERAAQSEARAERRRRYMRMSYREREHERSTARMRLQLGNPGPVRDDLIARAEDLDTVERQLREQRTQRERDPLSNSFVSEVGEDATPGERDAAAIGTALDAARSSGDPKSGVQRVYERLTSMGATEYTDDLRLINRTLNESSSLEGAIDRLMFTGQGAMNAKPRPDYARALRYVQWAMRLMPEDYPHRAEADRILTSLRSQAA